MNDFKVTDLIDQRFTRNSEMIGDIAKKYRINILGVGSIGSLASLCFAKTGFLNQRIYDIDTVDINNIGPQIYGPKQIGKSKTDAMIQVINTLVGENEVKGHYWKIGESDSVDTGILYEDSNIMDIFIIAVDCMEVRQKLYDLLAKTPFAFIDARMSIAFLQLYAKPWGASDSAYVEYRKTLFSNADAVPTPCTDKATAFTSFIAGGVIVAETINMIKLTDIGFTNEHNLRSICYDIRTHDLFTQELG